MARRNSTMHQADEDAAVKIGQGLSKVILHLALRRGFNQATFAEQLGYSRASFNQILKSKTASRLWRLPGLCAVVRVLGVSLADLIKAAESKEPDLDNLPMTLALAGTMPKSSERLSLLTKEALHSYPGMDELLYGDNHEALMGCRMRDIELGAPEFYAQYANGEIGDPDALAILSAAREYVSAHGGLGEFPFWAAIKKVWTDKQ